MDEFTQETDGETGKQIAVPTENVAVGGVTGGNTNSSGIMSLILSKYTIIGIIIVVLLIVAYFWFGGKEGATKGKKGKKAKQEEENGDDGSDVEKELDKYIEKINTAQSN